MTKLMKGWTVAGGTIRVADWNGIIKRLGDRIAT